MTFPELVELCPAIALGLGVNRERAAALCRARYETDVLERLAKHQRRELAGLESSGDPEIDLAAYLKDKAQPGQWGGGDVRPGIVKIAGRDAMITDLVIREEPPRGGSDFSGELAFKYFVLRDRK